MNIARFGSVIACAALCLLVSGCAGRVSEEEAEAWRGLVDDLVDLDRIARLDVTGSHIVTSHDPTGGNDDYSHYLREGPKGWWVLADLDGPGYVSRFWMTGVRKDHKLRFYFGNERRPRIEKTLEEFFQNSRLFPAPLSEYEQQCRYSYVPIPYQERLIIMAEPGGTPEKEGPKLYFQINYNPLPPDSPSAGLPMDEGTQRDRQVIDRVSQVWADREFAADVPAPPATPGTKMQGNWRLVCVSNNVAAEGSTELAVFQGPAVVRRLEITPELSTLPPGSARENVLRETVLCMTWDDAEQASVEVPLGDFFGSFGRRTRFKSMFVGMKEDTFFTLFAMPFETRARLTLRNEGQASFPVLVGASLDVRPAVTGGLGYFHACWQRTTPRDVGKPHPIVQTRGRGTYVGCILNTANEDRSWWLLEGDETMVVDRGKAPTWQGTGLEDYFNGGWYYFDVLVRPLSGLLFKSPFRTLQYRFHVTDPVRFASSMDMTFERGPNHASRGWMESVGYYYLAKPSAAASRLGSVVDRGLFPDPFEGMTLMKQILDRERIGDFRGAHDRIDELADTYAGEPFMDVLRLRQLMYRARWSGFESVRSEVEAMATKADGSETTQQAKLLLWFHEDRARALLGAFCNARTTIYLDGDKLGEFDHPERLLVRPLVLKPGKHVLVLESSWSRQMPWVQVCLRTHGADIVTGPDWLWARDAGPGYRTLKFDDSGWERVRNISIGPPQEPFYRVEPNAFVGMQSEAKGMRAFEWKHRKDTIIFRKVFSWSADQAEEVGNYP